MSMFISSSSSGFSIISKYIAMSVSTYRYYKTYYFITTIHI